MPWVINSNFPISRPKFLFPDKTSKLSIVNLRNSTNFLVPENAFHNKSHPIFEHLLSFGHKTLLYIPTICNTIYFSVSLHSKSMQTERGVARRLPSSTLPDKKITQKKIDF